MSEKIKNPWDLAWSKWWVQQNYKKCEVDEMTLCCIQRFKTGSTMGGGFVIFT